MAHMALSVQWTENEQLMFYVTNYFWPRTQIDEVNKEIARGWERSK